MITMDHIFSRYLPQYLDKYYHKLLASHKKTIRAILACRTPRLGGRTWHCPHCDQFHYSYYSCNNRMCPKCQNRQATDWLDKQLQKLLPVKYYMITFTIPQELRAIFRSNQKECYNLLFKASSESLKQLALDQRFLGGDIGMLGVLQTWAGNLVYHPHIHYIVPGLGISKEDNSLVFPKNKKCLIHNAPLKEKFRGKLMDFLKKSDIKAYISPQVWDKKWAVDVREVGTGIGTLKYLSRYVYRTAISNQNILSCKGGKVTFRYKDNTTKKYKIISLPALEFIRRFLQHTLPKGFQKVRYFGLLHPKRKQTLYTLQIILRARIKPLNKTAKNIFKCPKCGSKMELVKVENRKRAPPFEFYFPDLFDITEPIDQYFKLGGY